jgi:hypothetical protein
MLGAGSTFVSEMAFGGGKLGRRNAMLAAADARDIVELLKNTAFGGATIAQMLPRVHQACIDSTVHQKLKDRSAAWLIAHG